MHRFYNAGHKIDEVFHFSLPEGADVHVVGRWSMIAPKEGWFEVPRELNIGASTIAVQFYQDIKRRFGKRGVVLLDPKYDPATEDPDKPLEFYPVAPTEELVIKRGEELWQNYLEEICKAHFEDVQNAMSAGGAPRAARGFTVHALKLRGYRDPATDYFFGMKEGAQGRPPAGLSPEVAGMMAQMQQQNALMMSVLLALASGEKIDPELIRHGMKTPPPSPPSTPAAPTATPDNAGSVEVEGQNQTSLEQRISNRKVEYETAQTKHGGKKERSGAALKEL